MPGPHHRIGGEMQRNTITIVPIITGTLGTTFKQLEA